ncbi:MAG: hypothetical protein MJK12_13820, partial [Colwellia sp.]|nr:hypothetical protein [Colwellia sp.]
HQFIAVAKYSDNVRIFSQLAAAGVLTLSQQQVLTHAYCQLRDQGHRAALQNEQLLLNGKLFQQLTEDVMDIWQEFLKKVD